MFNKDQAIQILASLGKEIQELEIHEVEALAYAVAELFA